MFGDLFPGDLWAAKHFFHGVRAFADIHRASTRTNIHDTPRLTEQRHESFDDSLGTKKIRIHHNIWSNTMAKTSTRIVDNRIELHALCIQNRFHNRRCGDHWLIWRSVELHFTFAFAGCWQSIHDRLHSSGSLLKGSGTHIYMTAIVIRELLAQCKTNAGISTRHQDVLGHDFWPNGFTTEKMMPNWANVSLHSNTSIDRSAVNGPVKIQNLGSLPIQPLAKQLFYLHCQHEVCKASPPYSHIQQVHHFHWPFYLKKIKVATLRASALVYRFSSSLFAPSLDRTLEVEICDRKKISKR